MPNTTKTPSPASSADQFYKAHGVPEDIKSRLESTAILLISATRRSTEETFELGEHLEKAATLLPEGTVETWAAERCGYTARRSCPGEWCSWLIAKPLASAPSNVL